MTDRDFELLLQEDISALPPNDELAGAVNPWRLAMNRILWGLALVMVTLNFLNLDVILPAVGVLMMLLGFRMLRSENGWFRLGYYLAIARCIWLLAQVFWDATIFSSEIGKSNAAILGTYAMLVVGFIHLLCLRGGIRAVQKKAGLEPHSGSANALLVFYCVITALALVNFQGFTIWFLLIAYICILRGLFKLSGELDDAGYAITPAPPRITDGAVKLLYAATVALLLAVGYLGFSQYPMDWQPAKPQSESVAEIRSRLLDLGFPENILDDLTDEEILACRNAEKVYVDSQDYPVNDGREVAEQNSAGIHIYTTYDVYELRITGIAVEPEDQMDPWIVLHHFQWLEAPGWLGTDGLQLWPVYRMNQGWLPAGHLSGRVLYNEDSATYTAPYHSLGEVTGTSESWFLGEVTGTDIIATFSFPRDGENCRGYVCYTTRPAQQGYILDSWCNYYYQQHPAFPVCTPDAVIRPGIVSTNPENYRGISTALQVSCNVDKALESGVYDYEPLD